MAEQKTAAPMTDEDKKKFKEIATSLEYDTKKAQAEIDKVKKMSRAERDKYYTKMLPQKKEAGMSEKDFYAELKKYGKDGEGMNAFYDKILKKGTDDEKELNKNREYIAGLLEKKFDADAILKEYGKTKGWKDDVEAFRKAQAQTEKKEAEAPSSKKTAVGKTTADTEFLQNVREAVSGFEDTANETLVESDGGEFLGSCKKGAPGCYKEYRFYGGERMAAQDPQAVAKIVVLYNNAIDDGVIEGKKLGLDEIKNMAEFKKQFENAVRSLQKSLSAKETGLIGEGKKIKGSGITFDAEVDGKFGIETLTLVRAAYRVEEEKEGPAYVGGKKEKTAEGEKKAEAKPEEKEKKTEAPERKPVDIDTRKIDIDGKELTIRQHLLGKEEEIKKNLVPGEKNDPEKGTYEEVKDTVDRSLSWWDILIIPALWKYVLSYPAEWLGFIGGPNEAKTEENRNLVAQQMTMIYERSEEYRKLLKDQKNGIEIDAEGKYYETAQKAPEEKGKTGGPSDNE